NIGVVDAVVRHRMMSEKLSTLGKVQDILKEEIIKSAVNVDSSSFADFVKLKQRTWLAGTVVCEDK
ncbi:hypothetical protein HDV02_006289, partial [Globomyces sp. JEL0801]